MHFERIFLSMAFVACLLSCGQEDTNLNIENNWDCTVVCEDSFDVFSCYSECNFIKLENTPESKLGQINKVIVSDTICYVLDKDVTKKIFVFSLSGEYIKSFGTVGHSSTEYSAIYDITLDSERSYIYALCNKCKVVVFDVNGKAVTVKELPFLAENLEYQNGKFYFIGCDEDKGNLLITDEDFNILNSYFGNSDDGINRYLIHPLSKSDDGTITYFRYLDNNIYRIHDDNTLSVAYSVDFGDNSLSRKDVDGMDNQAIKDLLKQKRGHIKYFSENEDYAYILFFDENNPCMSVYDRKAHSSKTYDYFKMYDSSCNRNMMLMEYSFGNSFYDVLHRENVMMDDNMLDSLFTSDNPVLYKLSNK